MIHFNYYIQAHHEPSFVVEPAMKMLYANPLQAGSKSRLERIRRGVVDDGGGIVIGERLRRQFPGSVARKRAPLLELRRTVGVFLARGLADVRQHLLFATKSGDELAQCPRATSTEKKCIDQPRQNISVHGAPPAHTGSCAPPHEPFRTIEWPDSAIQPRWPKRACS
jgi:hypothetical protein